MVGKLKDKKSVCMCLFNNFTHDSRVLKEASSLFEIGYSVKVLARLDDSTLMRENIKGIAVRRISVNPVHIELRKLIRKLPKFDVSFDKTNGKIDPAQSSSESCKSSDLSIHTEFQPHGFFRKGLTETKCYFRKVIRHLGRIVIRWIEKLILPLLLRIHRPLIILSFNYKLFSATKGENYDVFHAHDFNTLIGAYFAARAHGANLIYDSHELYLERNRFEPYNVIGKRMRRRIEGYLIKRSDHVITVNDSLARMLANTYSINLPTVIMNVPSSQKAAAPSQYTSLRDALRIQHDYNILLYAGSITFNRGLENLIAALVYLPQCFLVLMGYSNETYRDNLQTLAEKKEVASRFAFFGPVPTDEVTLYASTADLGVAPIENVCLSYYYCSPNKVFEYLLAGLPVIASDFPEMSYIINKYGVGGTFDPSAPEDIARAVMAIFEAPEKWKDLSEKTKVVASTYNWEKESQKLISVYQSLS